MSLAALWITLFSPTYTSSFNFSSNSGINCFMFQKLEFLFLKLFLEIQFFKELLFIPSNFLQIGKFITISVISTNITSFSIIQYLTISIPAVLTLCPMTLIHSSLFSRMFGGIILWAIWLIYSVGIPQKELASADCQEIQLTWKYFSLTLVI